MFVHSNSFVGLLHQNIYYFSCIPLSNDFTFEVFICQSGNQDYFNVAKLLVGVATLSLMPAVWIVVILLHETGSQGEPFGPEIKTFTSNCLNVSTTPIMAMGCRQCLPLSVVQLKGKHCKKKPIAVMGL